MIIGGGQIPVSMEIAENIRAIKSGIDWAHEQGLYMFLTPECALSGYTWAPKDANDKRLKKLKEALPEIIDYAKEKNVNIALGTAIFDDDTFDYEPGKIWRNQVRVYVNGELVHKHNKILTTHDEPYVAGTELNTFMLEDKKTAVLICNDLWACGFQTPGDAGRLAKEMKDKGVELCLLAVNAPRIKEDEDYFYTWSDIHVQTYSRQGGYVIMVSDNSLSQYGHPWIHKVGSPSGIMDPNRGWMSKTPATGTHYYKWNWKYKNEE